MSNVNVTLGPGRYFIGDLSFVLPANVYNGWVESGRPNGLVEFENNKFAVCATDSGDGTFRDDENLKYVVRDSHIGLVPEAMWDPKSSILDTHGRIIEAKDKVVFEVEDGMFYVTVDGKTIEIETDYDDDEEDDYWEEYDPDYFDEEDFDADQF